MKKIFGMEAEFNITADEEIIHGLGKGYSKWVSRSYGYSK